MARACARSVLPGGILAVWREPVPYGQPLRQDNAAAECAEIKSAQHPPTLTGWQGYCSFNGERERFREPPFSKPPAMHSPSLVPASVALKVSALFVGALSALFVVSLASEDQRRFAVCRAAGNSSDACLLLIGGR